MKKIITLLKVTILAGCVISGTASFAQDDVGELIKSSPADATKLANAYLTPLFKGLGIGLNSGWNNTAATKGTGRFEIRVSASGVIIPDAGKNYDVTKLGLSSRVSVASGSGNIAPTVGGSDNAATPVLDVKDGSGNTIESFALPKGAGLPLIPAPQVQATIGLPKSIDLTLRLMPKIKVGDAGEIGMIGGGLKVNVLRFINKKADKIAPFDLAVAVGYTQLNYSLGLDVPPPSGSVPKDASQIKDFTTQRISAKFSGTNFEAIISKKLLFFTPFLSVGYMTAKTDVGLLGNYPIITDGVGSPPVKQYTSFTDPITIKQTDISGLNTTVGFKLNLTILRIFASYSMAEYNSLNAGIGLGIGK